MRNEDDVYLHLRSNGTTGHHVSTPAEQYYDIAQESNNTQNYTSAQNKLCYTDDLQGLSSRLLLLRSL